LTSLVKLPAALLMILENGALLDGNKTEQFTQA
jgi:hypothetical protein